VRKELSLFAIFSIIASLGLIGNSEEAFAAIYVKIPGIRGDVTTEGYDTGEWFTADSFSFGVEREMKESGEKGGTEDINIGVGELQECTISKSMDINSPKLAQNAIEGTDLGVAEIHFVETTSEGKPMVYLKYKLERAFIKSWSTSGDADDRPTEEVAFYYNKIAFSYSSTNDGRTFEQSTMSWDNVKNVKWTDHGLTTQTATLTR